MARFVSFVIDVHHHLQEHYFGRYIYIYIKIDKTYFLNQCK